MNMPIPRTASLLAAPLVAMILASAGGALAATPTANSGQIGRLILASNPDLVCQIAKSGNYVHIQALNKGKSIIPAGTLFHLTIVGPTKKTTQTKTLKSDLAPGASVNVTNAIKASSVVSCTPAA
jgi:hypothetical protein